MAVAAHGVHQRLGMMASTWRMVAAVAAVSVAWGCDSRALPSPRYGAPMERGHGTPTRRELRHEVEPDLREVRNAEMEEDEMELTELVADVAPIKGFHVRGRVTFRVTEDIDRPIDVEASLDNLPGAHMLRVYRSTTCSSRTAGAVPVLVAELVDDGKLTTTMRARIAGLDVRGLVGSVVVIDAGGQAPERPPYAGTVACGAVDVAR